MNNWGLQQFGITRAAWKWKPRDTHLKCFEKLEPAFSFKGDFKEWSRPSGPICEPKKMKSPKSKSKRNNNKNEEEDGNVEFFS